MRFAPRRPRHPFGRQACRGPFASFRRMKIKTSVKAGKQHCCPGPNSP